MSRRGQRKPLQRVQAAVAAVRSDGWYNTITKLGTGLDRNSATGFAGRTFLDARQLAHLYDHDWLAQRAADIFPDAAFTREPTFELPADQDRWREINYTEVHPRGVLREGLVRGRVFGGAAVLKLSANVSGDLARPMAEGELVTSLDLLNRDNLDPVLDSIDRDPRSATFGQASVFKIVNGGLHRYGVRDGLYVHRTRLVICEGETLLYPMHQADCKEGFPVWQSLLQSLQDAISRYDLTWKSVSALLEEASISVLTMQGLAEMIASTDSANIAARFEAMRQGRTVLNTTLLGPGEDFRRDSLSFGGISDLLIQSTNLVCAALRVSPLVFFGQAPSGLNASADSILEMWANDVARYQRHAVIPKVEDIVGAKPSFPPLREPTPEQAAKGQSTLVQVVQQLLDAELVDRQQALDLLRSGDATLDFASLPTTPPQEIEPETLTVEDDTEQEIEDKGSLGIDVQLAPTGVEKIMLVREARARANLQGRIPDDDMTIAAFEAKQRAQQEVIGTAEGEEISGTEQDAPSANGDDTTGGPGRSGGPVPPSADDRSAGGDEEDEDGEEDDQN